MNQRTRRRAACCGLIAGFSVLIATSAGAQPQADVAEVLSRQDAGLARSRAIQSAPGVTSPYALPTPDITLTTTKEGTVATAVIGYTTPFWGFRTTVKTPIGKEDDAEASPVSFSGLANQASVDVAYIKKRIFRDFGPTVNIDNVRLALCKERGIDSHQCSDQAFSDPKEREQFLDLGMYRHPTVFTAHVQAGGKSFDFIEKGASTKQSESFTSVAAGASYGWLFLASQSVIAINVDYAHDYAGSKDSTLFCQPIATDVAGTERCDTRTIGRPKASEKTTATVDYRKVFTHLDPTGNQSVPMVGLSIQAHVQATADADTIWGIEAPVYFLQKSPAANKSVSLNGGASAAWDSKDGFAARVFIGTSFALLGKDFGQ